MFDVEMRYVAASQRWCAAHDVARAEIIGRSCYEVNPQLSEPWRDVHNRCLAGGADSGERQIRQPVSGTQVWVHWEARAWRTDVGTIGGIVVRLEDITAGRHVQEALAERERQLQFALDASQAGTWIADTRTRRVVLDRRTCAIFGMSPDADATIDDVIQLIASEDRERLAAARDHVVQSPGEREWSEEFRVMRPDGTLRWVHSRGRSERDARGQLVSMAGIALDVTEWKEAEAATHMAETQARLALDASAAFAWSWDPKGGPWVLDEPAALLLGVRPGPFPLSEYLTHVHADDRGVVAESMAALRADHGPTEWDAIYRVVMPTGREVYFHSRGTAQRDAKGRVTQFHGITMDVTARRTVELELERSHATLRAHAAELERRSSQLQQLATALMLAEQRTRERLSRLLHDHLQQLLFSALLNVGRVATDAPQLGLLRLVHGQLTDAIEETRSLSVDLLPSMLRRGDLPGALTWLGEWMHDKYGLVVDVDVDPGANPTIDDIRFVLFESVRELLFNVVKHSAASAATLSLAKDDRQQFVVVVSDQGKGFDPGTLSARPTADEGLGLFGMRERLALFGGQMQVESAPGQGARFTLVIPGESPWGVRQALSPDAEISVPWMPATVIEGPRPLRILVADDHATVREAVRRVLMKHPGFLVVGDAADGVDAVHQSRMLAPDVIIIDVSMPRMDGIEAIRRIRKLLPMSRIFGLSSDDVSVHHHSTEVAGADGYFVKGSLTPLVEQLLTVHSEVCGVQVDDGRGIGG